MKIGEKLVTDSYSIDLDDAIFPCDSQPRNPSDAFCAALLKLSCRALLRTSPPPSRQQAL